MSVNKKEDKKSKKINEDLDNMIVDDLDADENIIVEMTDEEGNVYLYEEEMILPIDNQKFALLVALPMDDEEEHNHEHGCDCGCGCDEDDVIIAKIVTDQNGEEIYIEPTDEEFEMVRDAYNDYFFSDELEEEQARD